MELFQLRYFAAVARLQHMTRAAQLLHISQPALTKSIHKLEEELGVALLEPRGRGVALTEAGHFLQERIREPLDSLARIPEELHRAAKQRQSTVRVNVLSASDMVTEAIIRYKKAHDALHFVVVQNAETDLADVCVTTAVRFDGQARGQLRVFREEIRVAVPVHSAWARRDWAYLRDFSGGDFICLSRERKFREICDQFCHQAGFLPNVVFESDNPGTVRNLIAAGSGIGFWPDRIWGDPSGEVKLLSIKGLDCSREILLRNNHPEFPAAAGFFQYLAGTLESLLGE